MAAVNRTLPSPPELQSRWAAVLEEAGLRPRILALHDRFPEERSLEVPFSAVDGPDTPLADVLLERPDEVLAAGIRAMRELLPVAGPEAEGLRLRIVGLPATSHRLIRAIRENDLNHLIAIDGIVRRVTEVRPQIRDAVFQCVACRTEFHEPQEEGSMVFREPLECPESQGGCGKPIGRTRFRLLAEKSSYVDAQRIEIQEHPETLRHGAHPQGLSVLLTEDLAGRVLPGNRIVLNGVLKSFQRASGGGRTGVVRNTTFDLMVLGNSFETKELEYDEIEISPEDEALFERFRGDPTVVDKIVLSLAPTIKGMEEEKEAVALQLFGGVEKHHADGVRVRGDIHVLLVGDPGTAKSQLLRYIADVAPRGVYTSGKGSTAAGLTAAAVKDDFAGGRWVLEAGMLVLADGGMAVIDELDKMSPEDRSAMHEALEQQSYPPEFELMLANGEKRPIGALVEAEFRRRPGEIVTGHQCWILPGGDGAPRLLSTDLRTLQPRAVEKMSRHVAPDQFVRVGFSNGRTVTVTPGHPMWVWEDGAWTTRPADRLRPGSIVPGVRELPRSLNEATFRAPHPLLGRTEITFPSAVDDDLARLLGYLVSVGHVPDPEHGVPSEVSIADAVPGLCDDARGLFRSLFGIEPYGPVPAPAPTAKAVRPRRQIRAVGVDLLRYFWSNFPEFARPPPEKRVPGAVFHAEESARVQFLLGAFRGHGFCDSRRFGLRTSSRGLAGDYADLLLSLGIYSALAVSRHLRTDGRPRTTYQIVISGQPDQRAFYERIARHDPRGPRILEFVERRESRPNDADGMPRDWLLRMRALLHEWELDDRHRPAHPSLTGRCHRTRARESARRLTEHLDRLPSPEAPGTSPDELRRRYAVPISQIADDLGRSPAWVRRHDRSGDSPQSRSIRAAVARRSTEKLHAARARLATLSAAIEAPIRFETVRSVEVVPNPGVEWVYDVTVEPDHTFVSEGLVLHNTVSIAKAGITSTLNARCPVLAAANPKWGRFTPDRSIAEQIDLPPTLLSRFDVIFSIKDVPDQARDRRLANRILASAREVELIHQGSSESREGASAPFSPELLKKYIAYSRRKVRPILSPESLATLEDFYVRVRRQGEEPNAPVPITARQLEALVRMSEAAARARLSSVVTVEDAERAIRIMENYLRRVSMTEEGKLDIDLTQSGVSHSQRERQVAVLQIMRELQSEHDGLFTLEQFRAAVERAHIDPAKAESLLQSMRNQGELIEPRPNQFQLVRF